jgi:hypothetical protein
MSRARSAEKEKAYDAYIYTHLPIDGLSQPDADAPSDRLWFMDMPCVSVERVVVRWSRYEDYLGAFVEGTKDPYRMRSKLLALLSPGLERLFGGQPVADLSVRIWWHSETPELEDLPWELIAYPEPSFTDHISFVRGAPLALAIPKVPIAPDAPLRLAYVHAEHATPPVLDDVLHHLPPSVELIDLGGDLRKALKIAVAEGFELLHIVADGIVSLAYEGVLYLPHEDPYCQGVEIWAGELSSLLAGSRVSLISLTETVTDPDTMQIGRYEVPSAYRAFAYLARSYYQPLPNIIVPLGPAETSMIHSFWSAVYDQLASSLSVEEAVAAGRWQAPVPMALFLRQNLKHTFHRLREDEDAPATDPNQVSKELQISYDMVDKLESIKTHYGELPDSVTDFLAEESARQERLESDLDPWMGSEGES